MVKGLFVDKIYISSNGLTVDNAYVSFKGTYAQSEAPNINLMFAAPRGFVLDKTKPIVISARLYIYTNNNVALKPVSEENIFIQCDVQPANPLDALYDYLKNVRFAGAVIREVV